MDGIVLINKPVGITSYRALSNIKRVFSTKKVGHCGTLDPFADGLIIACINQGTKIASYLEAKEKEYVATIQLGEKTNTGDLTGEMIEKKEVPPLSKMAIEKVLVALIGEQMQIPPMYSALKVDGKRLYELARQGQTIERKPRPITIFELELLELTKTTIKLRIRCSKGTYIRVLAEDIAEMLNTAGHLIALTRTKIGDFSLADALDPSQIQSQDLIFIPQALSFLPHLLVNSELKDKICNGMSLKLDANDAIILLVENENKALALYEKKQDEYKCLRGLWA